MPTSLEATTTLPPAKPGWVAGVLASLRENSPLLFMVAFYLSAANGLAAWLGRPYRALDKAASSYNGYLAVCVACFAFAFVIWFLHLTLVRKIKVRTGEAWRYTF